MSTGLSLAPKLAPLLGVARELGSRHVALFGSVVRRPLAEVADLDVHLVLPRMDRSAHDALVSAAEETARAVAAEAGRPWRIELRHGPFKPAPGAPRDLQLHLLLDDEASLGRLPHALLAHRAATGQLLAGSTLPGLRAGFGLPAAWLEEARDEMDRWRGALIAAEIPFRHWLFDPGPHLAENRAAAPTSWDLRCLLRGAAAAADLHYHAALRVAGRPPDDDFGRALCSQLDDEPPWQDLAGCWGRVRDEAVAVLERRLAHLAEIAKIASAARTLA